jgi:hypothetical protein
VADSDSSNQVMNTWTENRIITSTMTMILLDEWSSVVQRSEAYLRILWATLQSGLNALLHFREHMRKVHVAGASQILIKMTNNRNKKWESEIHRRTSSYSASSTWWWEEATEKIVKMKTQNSNRQHTK